MRSPDVGDVLTDVGSLTALVLAMGAATAVACFPTWILDWDGDATVDVKPFPERWTMVAAVLLQFVATVLGFVGVGWVHAAAVAAVRVSGVMVGSESRVGVAAMVLGWLGVAVYAVVVVELVLMMHGMRNDAADDPDIDGGSATRNLEWRVHAATPVSYR